MEMWDKYLSIMSHLAHNILFSVTDLTYMLTNNTGIIHYALFWNGNNGLKCAYIS